jgi:hypothetical protein
LALRFGGDPDGEGNWPKCGKHGVSREEIGEVLSGTPAVIDAQSLSRGTPDAGHRDHRRGRYVFLVFMLRQIDGETRLRPISARYMHQKEIAHHEGTR